MHFKDYLMREQYDQISIRNKDSICIYCRMWWLAHCCDAGKELSDPRASTLKENLKLFEIEWYNYDTGDGNPILVPAARHKLCKSK